MKPRVLCQRGDQRLRQTAMLKMPRHQRRRTINLSLAVERGERSDPDRPLVGRKIVEPLPSLAWNTSRRYIEAASEIEGPPGWAWKGAWEHLGDRRWSRAVRRAAPSDGADRRLGRFHAISERLSEEGTFAFIQPIYALMARAVR